MSTVIHWFQKDLRLYDNPAFWHAAKTGASVLPLYVLDLSHDWSLGAAQCWWLHHSLIDLQKQLHDLHLPFLLKEGNPLELFKQCVKAYDIEAVYWNEGYDPILQDRNHEIRTFLEKKGIEVKTYQGNLLHHPSSIQNNQGSFYKVFTQYWKKCCQVIQVRKLYPVPSDIKPASLITTDKLEDWKLLPTRPNWAKSFDDYWTPGEKGAQKQLRSFLNNSLSHYVEGRNRLDFRHTSYLSPHLHFGEISPQTIWKATQKAAKTPLLKQQAEVFLKEIGWREFCHQLLYHYPELPEKNFDKKFDKFKWSPNTRLLKAWQKGLTGYPVVDAAMRELWQTGFMHNRARMIVASFLTKDLFIPWQTGEAWFWDTLLDADLANNAANWQWVAGSGADAAPYFRIFNPVLQGEKFDPQGEYVKKWIPELHKLPKKYIHQPWEAPQEVLKEAGVQLGKNYPHRIVDHKEARDQAMALYKAL